MSVKQIWAFFLAGVLISGSGMGTLHTFIAHHDCHHAAICVIDTSRSETHVHDNRYAGDNCSLCDFLHIQWEMPTTIAWSLSARQHPSDVLIEHFQTLTSGPVPHWPIPRGPPFS
jgi:hypothetical protein